MEPFAQFPQAVPHARFLTQRASEVSSKKGSELSRCSLGPRSAPKPEVHNGLAPQLGLRSCLFSLVPVVWGHVAP